jgi:hypothetical protein
VNRKSDVTRLLRVANPSINATLYLIKKRMNASPYFSILRMKFPMDSALFAEKLSVEPRIGLHEFNITGQDDEIRAAFQHVHAYHITSARDDLPQPWFAHQALLQHCPKLLVVSTFGAGYDTVNLQDCTHAGICAVNQAGSNARARACRHVPVANYIAACRSPARKQPASSG